MITLINATVTQESWESVLFQPVLKAYPMCHSYVLHSIQQKPLAPTHMISELQTELANLATIYTSYRQLILAATQLLKRESSFDGVSAFNRHTRRSLLSFLGDALSCPVGTATNKDVSSIKKKVKQLTATQNKQQGTLVHIISVVNVTKYATQVNRQHNNLAMDAVERTHQDITTLYNITSSMYNSLSYQQVILHIHSILANLKEIHYII